MRMRRGVIHGPTIAVITLTVSIGCWYFIDLNPNNHKLEKIETNTTLKLKTKTDFAFLDRL